MHDVPALGNNIDGDPVRLPMPFCGPLLQCGSIQVPGLSLHPHLRITTKASPIDPPCDPHCFPVEFNSVVELTLNTRFSSIGDDSISISRNWRCRRYRPFADGGRILVQFGDQHGDYVPVAFSALPPSGFLAPPPAFRLPAYRWLSRFDEILQFPLKQYWVQSVALTDDPFDCRWAN